MVAALVDYQIECNVIHELNSETPRIILVKFDINWFSYLKIKNFATKSVI